MNYNGKVGVSDYQAANELGYISQAVIKESFTYSSVDTTMLKETMIPEAEYLINVSDKYFKSSANLSDISKKFEAAKLLEHDVEHWQSEYDKAREDLEDVATEVRRLRAQWNHKNNHGWYRFRG